MLEELRHLRYAPHILEDWEQFSAEGADVESLRELAVAISRLTGSEGEKLAREAEQLMAQRPQPRH